MWMLKVVSLVLAVMLCIASGSLNEEEATKPGLQSAFTSKGLAYSELVQRFSAGEKVLPFNL